MTTINLLWPRWAEIVSRLRVEDARSWKTLQRVAALIANRFGREQDARSCRQLWAERRHPVTRELWARPRHRLFRSLVVLALSLSAFAPAAADDEKDKGSALFRGLGLAMYGAKTGDLLSTELLLLDGGVELNPFMQHRSVRIAATAAAPIVVNWSSEELRKRGHPKLALWMRISAVALFGYATTHNLRAAR